MQDLVAARQQDDAHATLDRLLERIVPDPALHARFLNTLARLEYIGVRKMLKTRRAEALDLDGLTHALEEASHALRLKKLAHRLAGDAVKTFAQEHTLAGDEGEAYFQAVDAAAERALADSPDPELNYLLTSAAIEVRAQAFYPLYSRRLRAAGAPDVAAGILGDEERHLAEMSAALANRRADYRPLLEQVMAEEAGLFASFVEALETQAQVAVPTA